MGITFRIKDYFFVFIIKVLKNRNFIFILAFILGLSLGHLVSWIKHLTLPALAIVMVVSMTQISIRSFLPLKSIIKPVLLTVLLNYFTYSFLLEGLSLLWESNYHFNGLFFLSERSKYIVFARAQVKAVDGG